MEVVASVAEVLIDAAKTEASYLCCFYTHVERFEDYREKLTLIRSEVLKHIEEGKERNETRVADDVQLWLNESDLIIQEDKKARKKWFHGWCPDCICKYRQGKKLAEKMLRIEDLIERSYYFYRLSYQAELPSMQYYSRPSFIDFESRKSRLEELVEALEIGNYNMIGLLGLGGTGKTTMAVQVGISVEQSKAFEKVIFVVVSDHPDINRIQADIAKHLNLYLEEREDTERSKVLCSRIANVKGRLLIILDDVWSALNLKDIGIPFGNNHKSCSVLVTSRDVGVCREMRCQLTIHLQTLTDEDALNLFMTHVNYDDLSRNDLHGIAKAVVKECKGLPIAIEVIARSLKNMPVDVWKDALRTLQDSQPWVDADEHFSEVYKCLQLSYDNLSNEKAKKLFLLCSLLPKDYEIRLSLLISLGIGAGIFGEIYKYWEARCQAVEVKNKLIDCSLLLKVEKEGVKMPELVREAAWWMAKEDTQMIVNSKVTPKSDLRFLFWSGYDFPNQFHCMELEVLFLWIKGYVKVEDANANFEEMGSLRVLFLCCDAENHLVLSLQSFLVLKNIRTLILNGWKLYDISILKNMQSLETLELNDCSIIELAKEIKDLKKLKLLGLRRCSIQMNNPFEVIGRCSQLEELYFVDNGNVEDWKLDSNREYIDKVSQDIPPPALKMYSIACSGLEYFDDDGNDMPKCFNTKNVMNLISGSMFQYLVEKAEVLELGGMEGTRWRSFVPDIIPIKDGAMNDLIKLCLYERYNIGYLIDANALVHSDATVFSKLVELHMRDVEVEGLCLGPIPSGFLQQLQVLKLSRCMKLLNIFLDVSLKLSNLKVLKLENCPMFQPSIFKRSVAASLAQLEELVIEDCAELSSLIAYDESLGGKMVDANHQNNYDMLFPSLQTLEINGCDKLKMVSPLLLAGDLPLLRDLCIRFCEQLRYVFDEYRHEGHFLHQLTLLPSLAKIELYWVPRLVNIFQKCEKWTQKPPPIVKDDSKEKHANSKTRTTDTNIAVPKAKMQTISLESRGSMKGIEIVFTAECLLRAPLYFQSMRQMILWEVSNIRSLFSVRIAETTMLEELEISYCEELQHIITNDAEDFDHKNRRSIFPKLQKLLIHNCDHLEFIFPSTLSGGLQKLKYLTIAGAFGLKYVFGNLSNDNETDEFHIDLPALEAISLEEVPNMVSICINSYHLKSDAAKATKMHMQNVTSAGAKKSEIEEIINVERPSSKYGFNFNNLQQIRIIRSPNLKTLFSTSTWRSLPQLSKLYICECDFLCSVVEDDSKDHGHTNYSSIFPKLENLQIRRCMNLEFIFPSFLSGGLQKLKHLVVKEAPKLSYIFGKFYDEDYLTNENESDEVQVDLSALETLSLAKVPNMINICAQKHTILKLPSLQNIALDNCQELTMSARPSADSTLYWKPVAAKDLMRVIMHQQKLTSLEVEECITEEIFNFEEYGEVEGTLTTLNLELMRLTYLRELRCICRSSKHVWRLHNLCKLEIKSCPELRVVFSASMSKSLPQLSHLRIEDCPKLVHLIEDDDEEDLPKLEYIGIEHCDSLKFLFSISESRMLPKLHSLQIVQAAKMEQVFTCEEDDVQAMALKDAFPILSTLILRGLPCLVTICGWINFHTVQDFEVVDCPRYQGPQDKAATMELPSAQEMPHMGPNYSKKVVLMLDLHNDKAKNKAMQIVSGILGVESISVDMKEKKLTLIGDIDPLNVVRKLRKLWHTELVSVELAKEPEKKKDECKKDDDKTNKEQNLLTSTSPNFTESSKQEMGISDDEVPIPPTSSVSVIESIEGDKETEKETGKVVVPTLELTNSRKVTEMASPEFRKKVVLKLDLHDDRAKNKAMKMVYGIQGVESISVDMKEKKLTLIGDIDPLYVVRKLRKVWHTELVSVELAKEPEKKKDECKKDDDKTNKEQNLLTSTSPNFTESLKLAMGISDDEEAPIPLISSVELEDEQTMSEPTVQLQHQDRGNDMKRREHSVVESIEEDKKAEKFLPSLFESIEGDKETEKEVGKVVVPALELTSPEVSSMKETDEQGFEEHDGLKEAILTRKPSDVPLDNSLGNEFALLAHASVEETLEQGLQEHDTSKNVQSADSESRKQSTAPLDMTEIGQRNKEAMKQGLQENYALEETTRIIQSANSSDLTKQSIEPFLKLSEKDFAEIVRRIKETMKQNLLENYAPEVKQNLQENYAPEEAVRVFQSPSSDVTKQSTEPFLKLSQDFAQSTKEVSKNVEEVTATEMPPMSTPFEMEFKRSLTIEETRGTSIEDRPMSVKPTRVNISNDVISSLHRQSQIGSASPSSSSIFETGEILELVELKDDERALLVKTLELYPKLRLSHRHRPIIAFAYRVLIDILIMLSTKNPYTMTEADKSTLEANLGAANYFGFDKDWVESVRVKIFDMDMVDILATREKMLVMEAELEVHDSALRQMRKERAESKERLAMARRKLEMAQSEFEVIDSQMLGLLVDYKLITKMVESGEVSAKDGTFGI